MKLHNQIQKFYSQSCNISLYLILFEHQAKRLEIIEKYWVPHFIGLLPYEIPEIITRESDNLMDDYAKIKEILLKRF